MADEWKLWKASPKRGSDPILLRYGLAILLSLFAVFLSLRVPGLMEAMERRDVDLRAQAHLILQQILGRPVAFDPYAPEALRRQQITGLREQVSRKAG